MGKTSKPMNIVAIGECALWNEELDALEKQGHKIYRMTVVEDVCGQDVLLNADIILSPRAWRMDDLTRKYLAIALKEARMLKYSGAGPRASKKNRADASADLDLPEAMHFPGAKYDPAGQQDGGI